MVLSASSQISAFGSHGVVEANVTFNHWRDRQTLRDKHDGALTHPGRRLVQRSLPVRILSIHTSAMPHPVCAHHQSDLSMVRQPFTYATGTAVGGQNASLIPR